MSKLPLQVAASLLNEESHDILHNITINEINIFGTNNISEDIFLELALDNDLSQIQSIYDLEYLSVSEIHVAFIDSLGHFIEMIRPLTDNAYDSLSNEGWVKLADSIFSGKELKEFDQNDVFIPHTNFWQDICEYGWLIPKGIMFQGDPNQIYFEELKVMISLKNSSDQLSMNMPLGDYNPEFISFKQVNEIVPEEIKLDILLENGTNINISLPLIEYHAGYKINIDKVNLSNQDIEIQQALAYELLSSKQQDYSKSLDSIGTYDDNEEELIDPSEEN